MKFKHLILVFLFIYAVGMILAAALSVPSFVGDTVDNNDKLFHFIEFFVLAIISIKTLQAYKVKKPYLFASIIGVAGIIISEGVQLFNTTRMVRAGDMIADVLGFAIGTLVILWISSKQSS